MEPNKDNSSDMSRGYSDSGNDSDSDCDCQYDNYCHRCCNNLSTLSPDDLINETNQWDNYNIDVNKYNYYLPNNVKHSIDWCNSGNLSKAIEIYNKCKNEINYTNNIVLCELLFECCENGNINAAAQIYNSDRATDKFKKMCMEKACFAGKLKSLEFFHSIGANVCYEDNYLLQLACAIGQISIAKLLLQMGAIINAWCLKLACAHGRLDIVKWIVSVRKSMDKYVFDENLDPVFRVNYPPPRSITEIVSDVCDNDHIEIAMVLCNTWKTYIRFENNNYQIFRYVCKKQHTEFAKIIYERCNNVHIHFDYPRKKPNIDILICLCKNSDIDAINWFCGLCKTMGDPIDINNHIEDCFIAACSTISYRVAQWLYELKPMCIADTIHRINNKMLSFFNFSHSTAYLLTQCDFRDNFNINLVDEVDDLALYALYRCCKYNILKQLENKFDSITLEIDDSSGNVISYHLNKNTIKSARKV